MQEQHEGQSQTIEVKPGGWWTRRRVWLGAALLLPLALTAAVVNYLAPTIPGRAEGFASRVEWYVNHGQLQADARTFSAAMEYVVQSDAELPILATPTNQPVAANPAPTLPRS